MKNTLLLILFLLISFDVRSAGYIVEEVQFQSHKMQLSGSIVFPETGEIKSAVVFVHGSGKQARNMNIAKRFASSGIVALVYDKRGAGKSGGEYEEQQSVSEKNINLLADDAVAALKVLRAHPKTKHLPLGFTGISQAGWIIPIAAEKSKNVSFIALWSAPVCKVSEEDIYSKYTGDKDAVNVPSYDEALKSRTQKYIWPDFLGKDSDPNESLATLNLPGLWIFGENDGSIPVTLSIQRLRALNQKGHKYDHVIFSNLGHNNMPETFSTLTDWIIRTTHKEKTGR